MILRDLTRPCRPLYRRPTTRVLVLVDAGHVDALERGLHAELRALAGVVGELGGVQQRLGRDAAVVQAGAAHLVRLDQGDGHAQLGGAQGGGVAAAASAQDDDVESGAGGVGHVQTPHTQTWWS